MRKSEIYDWCVFQIEQEYISGRYDSFLFENHLRLKDISTGIVLSSTEGEAGPISRAWGIIFDDCDKPIRCTEVHTSYYGESVALEKLLKEVTSK